MVGLEGFEDSAGGSLGCLASEVASSLRANFWGGKRRGDESLGLSGSCKQPLLGCRGSGFAMGREKKGVDEGGLGAQKAVVATESQYRFLRITK